LPKKQPQEFQEVVFFRSLYSKTFIYLGYFI